MPVGVFSCSDIQKSFIVFSASLEEKESVCVCVYVSVCVFSM